MQNYEIFTISDAAVCWETNLTPPPLQSDAVRIYKSKGSLTAEQQKSGRNQLWWFVENICWIMYTWHIKKCWNKKKFDCKLLWIKCLIKFLALFSFYSAQGFWKCSMTVEKINGKGWHPVCHILCCFFFSGFQYQLADYIVKS